MRESRSVANARDDTRATLYPLPSSPHPLVFHLSAQREHVQLWNRVEPGGHDAEPDAAIDVHAISRRAEILLPALDARAFVAEIVPPEVVGQIRDAELQPVRMRRDSERRLARRDLRKRIGIV